VNALAHRRVSCSRPAIAAAVNATRVFDSAYDCLLFNGSSSVIVATTVIELAKLNVLYQASIIVAKSVRDIRTEDIVIRRAISYYIGRARDLSRVRRLNCYIRCRRRNSCCVSSTVLYQLETCLLSIGSLPSAADSSCTEHLIKMTLYRTTEQNDYKSLSV
jgi:hypothetical protein